MRGVFRGCCVVLCCAWMECTYLLGSGGVFRAAATYFSGIGALVSDFLAVVYYIDSSYGGPVWKYVDDYYCMRSSHDDDLAEPGGLSSLGVVDLDTSIVPDGSCLVMSPRSGDVAEDFVCHHAQTTDRHGEPPPFVSASAGEGVQPWAAWLLPQCKEYVADALDRHMMNNH